MHINWCIILGRRSGLEMPIIVLALLFPEAFDFVGETMHSTRPCGVWILVFSLFMRLALTLKRALTRQTGIQVVFWERHGDPLLKWCLLRRHLGASLQLLYSISQGILRMASPRSVPCRGDNCRSPPRFRFPCAARGPLSVPVFDINSGS